MNLLVRQAMLAQPEAEVAPLEALENDREKRGKIFLPTLFWKHTKNDTYSRLFQCIFFR